MIDKMYGPLKGGVIFEKSSEESDCKDKSAVNSQYN